MAAVSVETFGSGAGLTNLGFLQISQLETRFISEGVESRQEELPLYFNSPMRHLQISH